MVCQYNCEQYRRDTCRQRDDCNLHTTYECGGYKVLLLCCQLCKWLYCRSFSYVASHYHSGIGERQQPNDLRWQHGNFNGNRWHILRMGSFSRNNCVCQCQSQYHHKLSRYCHQRQWLCRQFGCNRYGRYEFARDYQRSYCRYLRGFISYTHGIGW